MPLHMVRIAIRNFKMTTLIIIGICIVLPVSLLWAMILSGDPNEQEDYKR